MAAPARVNRRGLIILAVITCIGGMFVGGLGGWWAAYDYALVLTMQAVWDKHLLSLCRPLGLWMGIFGGLAVGAFWSWRMIRRIVAGRPGLGRMFAAGVGWGIVVGVAAGIFSHLGMGFILGQFHPITAVFFGAVGGLALGILCGLLAVAVAPNVRPDVYYADPNEWDPR